MKARKHICFCLIFLLPTALKDHLWEWVSALVFLKLAEGALKIINPYRILTIFTEPR